MWSRTTSGGDGGQTAFSEGTLRACLVGADEDSGSAIWNFRCRSEEDLRTGGNSYARPRALGKKDGWKEYLARGVPRTSAWYGALGATAYLHFDLTANGLLGRLSAFLSACEMRQI